MSTSPVAVLNSREEKARTALREFLSPLNDDLSVGVRYLFLHGAVQENQFPRLEINPHFYVLELDRETKIPVRNLSTIPNLLAVIRFDRLVTDDLESGHCQDRSGQIRPCDT